MVSDITNEETESMKEIYQIVGIRPRLAIKNPWTEDQFTKLEILKEISQKEYHKIAWDSGEFMPSEASFGPAPFGEYEKSYKVVHWKYITFDEATKEIKETFKVKGLEGKIENSLKVFNVVYEKLKEEVYLDNKK